MDKGYINSKIECPICCKLLAKNYMTNHLKSRHSNCYGTIFWEKYSDRYNKILTDNKKMFANSKE
jgi:hypothetical protein